MEDFNQLFDDDLFEIDQSKDKTIRLKQGERRMVAVLFADIKGFTALSEALDHEEVQTLVDQLMKIFSHCVEIHGGYVDKYTGDQIMALFGAKKASEVDTQRAINSAILMLEKLEKFNHIISNSTKYKDLNIDFSIRVGINTGMVTTGAVGKEREGDYTVYGDAVNLASRMESNAPSNNIMIPEETMTLVEDYFTFKDHGTIQVKGKSKPISVFLIVSNKDLSIEHSSLFIGREKEIDLLSKAYKNTSNNLKINQYDKLPFIGVTAEAGIGKTRLIQEYLKTYKDIDFSISHASNISSKPYYIFITLIKDIFKISEMDSLDKMKAKLEDGIKKLQKENKHLNKEIELAIPFIAFLIGIRYSDERLKDRDEIQNHLHISIKTLLHSVCNISNKKGLPYIIILDDMHWIDKMSSDMLEYLINTFNIDNKRNNIQCSQLLLLATYRIEYKVPEILINELKFDQIELEPLSKDDSIKLIKHSTSDIDINKQTILDLIDKSKGNPFFIEEWICLLKEKYKYSESIDESRGIKNIYEIPRSINALILARIDNLEKTLKLLLQKATIIGEDFFVQILSRLEKKLGENDNIDRPVHVLEDEDFIHHYINQLDHYKFKHMLTRDVAYSTILISNKVILHKAVAEIIEEFFSDKLETFYFDLAIHYDISKNHNKALKYLYLAGKKHSNLFDFTHAIQCFERILSIIESKQSFKKLIDQPKLSEKESKINDYYIKSKLSLSSIFLNTGNWEKSKKISTELLKYKNLSSKNKYELNSTLGQYYNFKHSYKESTVYLNNALKLAHELNNNAYIATIKGKLADCEYDVGNLDLSLEGFNEELSLFSKVEDRKGIAMAEGHIGMVLFHQGNLDKSLEHFDRKYKLAKKYDAKQMVLQALGNISLIHNIRGEFEKSLSIYKEVMSTAEDIYDLRAQAQTYGNMGIIFKNLSDYDKSNNNYEKQLKIAKKIDDKHLQSMAFSGFAIVCQKRGDFKKSIKYHNTNIEIKKSIDDKNGLASTYCNLSSCYFDSGDIKKAKNLLKTGLDIFNEIGMKRSVHIGNFELSKFLCFEDRFQDAINAIEPAIIYFDKIKDTIYLLRSQIQLSRSLRYNQNIADAKKILNTALKTAQTIKHNLLILRINIELNLCKTEDPKSLTSLEKLIKETKNNDLHAYIYFNIHKHTNDPKSKNLAKVKYLKLYKDTPKYEYKYYLDQLK